METICPNCLSEIDGDITNCTVCGVSLVDGVALAAGGNRREQVWAVSDAASMDDDDIVLEDFSNEEPWSSTEEISLDTSFDDEQVDIAPVVQLPAKRAATPPLPVREASGEIDQDSRVESGFVVWLTEVVARFREAYRELSVAAIVCLLGGLTWAAPYHRVAGGILIGAGLLGVAYLLVLAPRRIVPCTPINAVQAYFQALGHYLPDYARMYPLLTSNARRSTEFVSYWGFRAYWRYQLCRMKPAGYLFWPVDCRVDQLKLVSGDDSDLSIVTYRLRFYLRSRSDQPLRSLAMETNVVRGPDDRWYLNDGRLVGLEDSGT